MRSPDFPSDMLGSLEDGAMNLFEAGQLARVTANRMEVTPVEQSACGPTFPPPAREL
jgi:hypothetical protein